MLAAMIGGVHLIAMLGFSVGVLVILMASTPIISAQDLTAINRVYLLSAIALLVVAVAGAVLWLAVGKPPEFYSNNPVFHAKLGLFALLVVTFIYTGLKFLQLQTLQIAPAHNNVDVAPGTSADESIIVSNAVRRLQKTFIPLLLVIPVLAWMMARGIGY
jgi:putative membrane protein